MSLEKFENLVLCIAEAVPNGLNTVKLNKLLWLMDKEAYLKIGSKITGSRYLRKKYGPVPVDNTEALCVMRDKNTLSYMIHRDEDLKRYEYFAHHGPDKSVFNDQEKNIINRVLDEYRD